MVSNAGRVTPFQAAVPWLVLGFLVVLGWSLSRRLAQGATWEELWSTRFYEVRAMRAGLVLSGLMLVSVLLAALVLELRLVSVWWDRGGFGAFVRMVLGLGVVGGLGWAVCQWWMGVVTVQQNPPPAVSVSGVHFEPRIEREAFSSLGAEQFPNLICPRQKEELRQRMWLIGGGVGVAGLTLLANKMEDGLPVWYRLWLKGPEVLRFLLGWLPDGLGWGVAAVVGGAAGVFLWLNRTYALLTFQESLKVLGACAGGLAGGLAMVDGVSANGIAQGLAWLAVAAALRWLADLGAASHYRKMKETYEWLADGISASGVPLAEMKGRPECALPALDAAAVAARISQGCRNAESQDALVMRNFGRFLQVARVGHEMTTVGMLRFLTVGREVGETCCGGTVRALQNPDVPAWNETLFPLKAPAGFVNWLDPLGLAGCWDRVSWCGNCGGDGKVRCSGCGGSGRVTRQESDRAVTESCGTCGGSGKVTCTPCSGLGRQVFSRTLNTQWQRLMPARTAPAAPMAELFEEAEERVYYRHRLLEDRQPVPAHQAVESDLGSSSCVSQLAASAAVLQAGLQPMAEAVRELHGARYVYRADFQVTGFWTLRIGCHWLKGKVGWFFGRRPEFYFPRLPLSWGFAGTVALMVPLVFAGGPQWIRWLERLVDAVQR